MGSRRTSHDVESGLMGTSTPKKAILAAFIAMMLITVQIVAKSARDAMFLGAYGPESLPLMVFGAALASLSLVFPASGLMSRFGPRRIMPVALFVSAGLFVGEWFLGRTSTGHASIALYLHIAALGAVLISGFWSVVSEAFDPRGARHSVATISAGATAGGLVGGILADRLAVLLGTSTSLVVLAIIHAGAALLVGFLRPQRKIAAPAEAPSERPVLQQIRGSLSKIFSVNYLRNLALMVLLVTIAATLIDYIFKHSAAGAYTSEDGLMQFFAKFYAAIGIVTFLVQTIIVRRSLESIGLARTIQAYPVIVSAGLVAALVSPGLLFATLVRGADAILQSSLFKSGYELMYAPIPPQEKRAAKPVIDVGFVRVADMIGSALVAALLFAPPSILLQLVAGVALVFTVGALGLGRRLHAGYLQALESGLKNRASELEMQDPRPPESLLKTMASYPSIDIDQVKLKEAIARREHIRKKARDEDHRVDDGDALVATIADLRSGERETVLAALPTAEEHPRETVAYVVELLAWDEVAAAASASLMTSVDRITGHLVDVLTDADEPFAVRRRLPNVLSRCKTQRCADGLVEALSDQRFEVRYRSGVALAHIIANAEADLHVDADALFRAIEKEVHVDESVWETRRLLDGANLAEASPFAQAVNAHGNKTLEHIFNLLSLAFDRDTLLLSYQGLMTDDALLRGLALEYLESIVPAALLRKLKPFLHKDRPTRDLAPQGGRTREEIARELMASRASIELNLDEVRKAASAMKNADDS